MPFDFFVGGLLCPRCGLVSDPDSSTNIQTKIRRKPDCSELSIGHVLDVDWLHIEAAGYYRVQPFVRANDISIVETWDCPACLKIFNWAHIRIEDSKIVAVETIELAKKSIDEINYITQEVDYLMFGPGEGRSGFSVERLRKFVSEETTG